MAHISNINIIQYCTSDNDIAVCGNLIRGVTKVNQIIILNVIIFAPGLLGRGEILRMVKDSLYVD
jgi:hypothetical protein